MNWTKNTMDQTRDGRVSVRQINEVINK